MFVHTCIVHSTTLLTCLTSLRLQQECENMFSRVKQEVLFLCEKTLQTGVTLQVLPSSLSSLYVPEILTRNENDAVS